MKLVLGLAAALAAILIVLPVGAAGGPKHTTIALDQPAPVAGDLVTFTVTQTNYANPYLLWVATKCSAAGTLVSAEYRPVQWNGDVSIGTTATFAAAGDSCTAYVWEFPASETPERYHGRDVAVSYAVGP
jgi:hypothetical protein